MLKSKDKFQLMTITKVKFMNLIKSMLATKVKNIQRFEKKSSHEIIHYDEKMIN